MSTKSNRQFFRFKYSTTDMPTITIDGKEYFITEISEGGLRFQANSFEFKLGEVVSGVINFDDGEASVDGAVFRRHEDEYVLASLQGVSFKLVLHEQRKKAERYSAIRQQD